MTGCPEVKETPYIGAVVLYLVLHKRAGVLDSVVLHSGEPIDRPTKQRKKINCIILLVLIKDNFNLMNTKLSNR